VTNGTVPTCTAHSLWLYIATYLNRGLFCGRVILPPKEHEHLPHFPLPPGFEEDVDKILKKLEREHHKPHRQQEAAEYAGHEDVAARRIAMPMGAGMAIDAEMRMVAALPVRVSASGKRHGFDFRRVPAAPLLY